MDRHDYLAKHLERRRPPGQAFWLSLAILLVVMIGGTVLAALL